MNFLFLAPDLQDNLALLRGEVETVRFLSEKGLDSDEVRRFVLNSSVGDYFPLYKDEGVCICLGKEWPR